MNKQQLAGTKMADFEPRIKPVERLEIIDLIEGDGEFVKNEKARILAHYTGALVADGTIFQSSHDGRDEPIAFPLRGVITGWTQGVPGMRVGGKRRLIIPANLAYGRQSPDQSIPPNSDLVFDIELIGIK